MHSDAVSKLIHIFDRQRVRRQRRRAAVKFCDHDFLFREIKDRLTDRLRDINRTFETTLNLGARCPVLSERAVITADLTAAYCDTSTLPYIVIDEEFLPIATDSLDLVVSNLCLHWTNDLPGALLQIRQALKPDGLFLAAFFGGDTLIELRSSLMKAEIEIAGGAGPRISPFTDIRDASGLLQRAGFALPVTDQDTITVTYENAFKLMADLRGMGESNALVEMPHAVPNRLLFTRAAEIYHERFADEEGLIPATFQVIYLHGWTPADSQPKPLKPGSAQRRLADALNSLELSTGEKAKPET